MSHYREDRDTARAAGCAFGLVIAAVVGLVYLANEAFKYRPQPYAPAAPDHPTRPAPHQPTPDTQWVELLKVGALLTTVIVAVLLLAVVLSFPRGSMGWFLFLVNQLGLLGMSSFIIANLALFTYHLWDKPPAADALIDLELPIRYLPITALFGLAYVLVSYGAVFVPLVVTDWVPSLFSSQTAPLVVDLVQVSVLLLIAAVTAFLAFEAWEAIHKQPYETQLRAWQTAAWERAAVKTANIEAQQAQIKVITPQPVVYTVYPPRIDGDYIAGAKLMQSLLVTSPALTFQIVGTSTGVYWRIVDARHAYNPQIIISHIESHLPGAVVVQEAAGDTPALPYYQQHVVFCCHHEYGVPLPHLELLKAYDPLMALTQRFERLLPDEQMVYAVMVLVETPQARVRAFERFQGGYIVSHTQVRTQIEGDSPRFEFNEQLVKTKLSGQLYHTYVVLTVMSKQKKRLEQLVTAATDIAQFELVGHNHLLPYHKTEAQKVTSLPEQRAADFSTLLTQWAQQGQPLWRDTLLVLSAGEIAALWHLPHSRFTATRISWAGLPVPIELTRLSETHMRLGEAVTGGRRVQVGLAAQDRAYHHYVVGKTGMGKSTLMQNLVMQDIAAGAGVVVLDPTGKLVEDILAALTERLDAVLYLDCSNPVYPVPLNPFRIPKGVSFEAVRTANLWALLKIYEDIGDYKRLRLVLGYVLEALLCDPQSTPLDIARLLTDDPYRASVIARMEKSSHTTQAAINYLRDFTERSRSDRREIVDPILHRTGAFLANRTLETMTCHPQALDVVSLMKKRGIILVNLAGESLETEVGGLVALLLSAFYMAAKSHPQLGKGGEPGIYIYVDEVERVLSAAFAELLSQVRKYGVSLTLAHQYMAQLSPGLVSAILGNVGTLLSFEVSDEDARRLAEYFEPELERTHLMRLGRWRMAVKTRYAGAPQPSFVVTTPPPPAGSGDLWRGMMHTASRPQKWLTQDQVRTWLRQRYEPPPPPPKTTPTVGGSSSPKQPQPEGLGDFE